MLVLVKDGWKVLESAARSRPGSPKLGRVMLLSSVAKPHKIEQIGVIESSP